MPTFSNFGPLNAHFSTLALFRPYRSLNAYAQVVGRVLRTIPESTNFEIDNNAVVIFHEKTGLSKMWEIYSKEVDRAKNPNFHNFSPEANDQITERDYERKEQILGGVGREESFALKSESYLKDLDFGKMIEEKRREAQEATKKQMEEYQKQNPKLKKVIEVTP